MDDVRQDEDWLFLRSFLPKDLDEMATRTRSLRRRRHIKSGEDLLRLALVYACDGISLRDVSAWCRETGFVEVSDVAVLKRLRTCVPFLRQVVSQLIEPVSETVEPLRITLLDATTLSRSKAKGVDFRVHVGYDVQTGQISGIELSDGSVAERLDRIPVKEGEVIVADMGYNGREPLWDVVKQGGHVLVRTHPKLSSFLDADERKVDLLAWARGIQPGEIRQMQVRTCPYRKVPAIKGRLIVVAASERSRQNHLQRLRRKAQRNSRQVTSLQEDAGRYIFLFTTLTQEQAGAQSLLDAYRLRWQIEILFKRIKGVLTLGELRARDKLLCEALILAKLILLLVAQKVEQAFSPWGCPLRESLEAT
jgi:IS4 transposase